MKNLNTSIVIGTVVDTNDPKQMGRVRAICPGLGDTPGKKLGSIPWAVYASPFGGVTEVGSRGREDAKSTGPVAYGMWAIPKVGASVLVACIDGDPRMRVWLGCLHLDLATHTLPHGRFSERSDEITQAGFDWDGEEGAPLGPFTTREEKLEPSFSQLQLAFTKSEDNVGTGLPDTPEVNYEYKTRGADRSVSGLTEETVEASNASFARDDRGQSGDGDLLQGYGQSRVAPNLTFGSTGLNYDSLIYSVTTPGFHSIAMDDSPFNCRMRLRTTHGNQIILDDTNERIYVSTPQGDTWIELDEKGNVDIYAKRNISFHAEGDFNVTADTIRMKAKTGIHAISEGEMRLHAKSQDMHIIADQTLRVHAETDVEVKAVGGTLYFEAGTNIDAKAGAAGIFEAAGGDLSLKASANTNLDAGSISNILAGGNVLVTGAQVHLNGPGAGSAAAGTGVTESAHKEAFWTSRVPEHEPWARVMTKASVTDQDTGNTHASSAEYTYDDESIGKTERGINLTRNPNWRR